MQTIDPTYNTIVVEYERDNQPFKVIRSCNDPELFTMLEMDGVIESIKRLYLSKGCEVFSIRKAERTEIELLPLREAA